MAKCDLFLRSQAMLAITLSGSVLSLLLASPAHADNTPECNVGAGVNSTECGADSVASGGGSTAIGGFARAEADKSTAVGVAAVAGFGGSTAVGQTATAGAIETTAVGRSATVTSSHGSALGAASAVLATNSVALGYGSQALESNTVSIGTVGGERRLVNVADGINGTDGVNVSQLASEADQRAATDVLLQSNISSNRSGIAANTAAIARNSADIIADTMATAVNTAGIAANTAAIANNTAGIAANTAGINDLYAVTDRDRRQAQRGTAVAVALTAAPMPSQAGRTSYTFNLATYRGAQAGGLSLAHRLASETPFAITVGASVAGKSDIAGRIGVAGEF
ncbi:hypothetical protein [Croceicoccus estronivorus]|uniref:hypothetical protein n=1 Tax=Croceicoccus estronivorus TaxID=1172626 RepID=UPI000B25A62D|nr:hypothetical protein [Croceicoccus estronivorus]